MGYIELLGVMVYGICVFAMWSYLYRENIAYRLIENVFVATGAATSLVFAIKYIQDNALTPLSKGNVIYVGPLILGLMVFLFYNKQYRYLYRIPVAFLVGVGTALSIRGAISVSLYTQVLATIKPLFVPNNMLTSVNNIIVLVGLISVASYFIFTFRMGKTVSGPVNILGKIGRYIMMAGFGASFGQVVIGRMSYFYAPAQTILTTEAVYLTPIALAFIIIDIYRNRNKK
jgi:hypothetical protein